jgi:ribose-phosphate pyrophosphokinase
MLLSLNSNLELAKQIAVQIGLPLARVTAKTFSDGETSVNIIDSARGKDVYVIQSTSAPVNENIMELLIAVDALKRASANSINVVMPYYGYARQDRKARAREPITSKLFANMLQVSGIDRLLTVDLHAAQIQGFFDIPVDHLTGAPLLASYFERQGLTGKEEVVVVSPDHGGVTRARRLSNMLGTKLAIIDKRRPKANVAEIMNIIGNVAGKKAILIDDMIDTAGTITLAANALSSLGATEVYACCTHGVLSGPAIERIENSAIKELIVLDTIQLSDAQRSPKIKQISIASLLAEAIIRTHEERPLSPLFETHTLNVC